MCGIVGFIKLDKDNKENLQFEQVAEAFVETSSRGKQATGFYSPLTGVIKMNKEAAEFVDAKEPEIKKAIKSGLMIGHCRIATGGFDKHESPPSIMANNHPHEGKRYILVHNGHFGHLPKIKKYKYNGNCDSELALSYVETFGIKDGLALLSKQDGFSLVIYDKEEEITYFFRESNPLVWSFDTKTGCMIFGSTVAIIDQLSEAVDTFGLNLSSALMPVSTQENHLMSVTQEGVIERHGEIKLRLTDHVLRNLADEVKNKMDLESFFDVPIYQTPSYLGSRHGSFPYSGSISERAIHRQGGMSRGSEDSSPGATPRVFTTIRAGLLRFHGPLVGPGDTTDIFVAA